ncbi:MAG: prealbumin-like fold domain-containing protein, partial [Gaiellales bacterium]
MRFAGAGTGSADGGRWRFRLLLRFLIVLCALALTSPAVAGPVGSAAKFEDDDGNLVDDNVVDDVIDWNSFAPVTWTGTSPFRQTDKVALGWHFHGIEDAQATTSDTGFAGGTKQDDDCASVISAKAPNKDDLKRVYLASKVGSDGHVYLTLGWVRIPQNTTSPSAHIGFEFNKATLGACPAAFGGLVSRTRGDMLIVYDFEGGATDMPVITLRRWVASGACEVASKSAPCWGTATNLTELSIAEAKVNTTATALDALGPVDPETLGINEFGEAGVDLTAAGVFPMTSCGDSFGNVYAVSRSSGNSGTAQMKDLVGPGDFTLQKCGRIVVEKVTNPDPDPSDTTFNFDFSAGGETDPVPFGLKNGQTKTFADLTPGSGYSVAETVPDGWSLTSKTCDDGSPPEAIDVSAGETVTCTFTNKSTVDAKIELAPPTAVNEVGEEHTVTATVKQDTGSGFTNAPDGTTVSFSLLNDSADTAFVGPSSCMTTNGSCSVKIKGTSTGSVDIRATTTFTVLGQPLTRTTGSGAPNSGDANKRYVDAKIELSPLQATNPVGQEHTVTATVQQDTGSGFTAAPNGTTVDFSLPSNPPGAVFVGPSSCTTTSGSCSVKINSSTAGSVTIHATTTFTVLGESLTRATGTGAPNSADANKRYV